MEKNHKLELIPNIVSRIRVLFVCYGNICRSPMAEFVFKKIVDDAGLSDRFDIASAATSGEHIGDLPDRRTAEELRIHGISCEGKRGRRMVRSDFVDYDYIVGMDRRNMEYILRTSPAEPVCEIGMLMEYADGGEVADPYYTGDFGKTYRDVTKGCRALLDHIISEHPELRE